MKPREWERVVAVLKHLGCQVYKETDTMIWVARAATYSQAIRKCPVPVSIQRHVISALRIAEVDYVRAFDDVR